MMRIRGFAVDWWWRRSMWARQEIGRNHIYWFWFKVSHDGQVEFYRSSSPAAVNEEDAERLERHVGDVLSENQTGEELEVERKGRQSGKSKKVCTTDPDATMATHARNRRLEPAYKQHTAVDDKVGVILDVAVTTGQTNEGEMIEPQVDEVKATTGIDIKTITADAGYSYAKVYGALERRRIYASRHQLGRGSCSRCTGV
jgi:hypothetical protein